MENKYILDIIFYILCAIIGLMIGSNFKTK